LNFGIECVGESIFTQILYSATSQLDVAQCATTGFRYRCHVLIVERTATMTHKIETVMSRRSIVLQGVACAAGAATILAAGMQGAAAGKLPPTAVSYRSTPKDNLKCGNCSLFEAPNACKSVSGNISPNGWCTIYRKA